jgi:ubiquinone/menaquinone biosynthesis C-methylase UbiE
MMTTQVSYRVTTIAANVGKEIDRLGAQVELFWGGELKQYVQSGLRDGMSIVELGCGPGFTTGRLLETFPGLTVTAVDLDPLLLDVARGRLGDAHPDRVEFRAGTIEDTGLPADTFDFALTRLVLEHLPDPVAAVREVVRILRPGGRAVFVDNDFEMHIMTFPPVDSLGELYAAYCRARIAEGGNPRIGRELPLVLAAGGLSRIGFEVLSAHSAVVGTEMFLGSEGVGIPTKLVRDGYLSSKALASISVGWRDMMADPRHAILRQLYLASGEKTTTHQENGDTDGSGRPHQADPGHRTAR